MAIRAGWQPYRFSCVHDNGWMTPFLLGLRG